MDKMNTTILAITALVVALGLVAAFTIAIPALDGHIALARTPSQRIQTTRVRIDKVVAVLAIFERR